MSQFSYTNKNNTYAAGTTHDYLKANIQVPTPGLGDISNAAASTQWVSAYLGNGVLRPIVNHASGLRITVTKGSVESGFNFASTEGTLEPISVVASTTEYVWIRWSDSQIVVSVSPPLDQEGITIAEVESNDVVVTNITNYGTKTAFAPIESPKFSGDPQASTPYVFDYDNSLSNTYWNQRHNYHFLFGYDAPYFFFNTKTRLDWSAGTVSIGGRTITVESGFETWLTTDPCLNVTGESMRIPILLLQTDSTGAQPDEGYIYLEWSDAVPRPDGALSTLGYLHLRNNQILGFETPSLVPFLSQTSDVPVKFARTIGNNVDTVFPIVHNLGTMDIAGITVRDTSTNILADPIIEILDTNTIQVTFSPTMNVDNQYRVVLLA